MKKIKLKSGDFALVDDDIFEKLSKYNWTLFNPRKDPRLKYAKRREGNESILLHREILGLKIRDGIAVDHINGDGLDNRRANLRRCTISENLRNRPKPRNNTSGIKGIRFDKARGKWTAEVCLNFKHVLKKRFSTKEEAIAAYENAVKKFHGEFAHKDYLK